jgi:hypothetical protein
MLMESRELFNEYYSKVHERLGGVITLYRPGRTR